MRRTLPLLMVTAVVLGGCATVQPWERGALAPQPMLIEDCPTHLFERNSEAYREGAIGANGGKSGGGCGCS